LRLDFDFVSEEILNFWGSEFDDTLVFNIMANGQTHEVFRTSVNRIPRDRWVDTGYDLFPGGDITAHHIGWTELSIDISAFNSFVLEVRIWDVGDSEFDSAVLLDNIRFTETRGAMPMQPATAELPSVPTGGWPPRNHTTSH